jgi:hypothetical protein
MGTNYYLRKNICDKCEHAKEELHIGKSSRGWFFAFQAHDKPYIYSVKDWERELKTGRIFNEYGEEVSSEDFWEIVKRKKKEPHNHALECPSVDDWVDENGNSFSRRWFS